MAQAKFTLTQEDIETLARAYGFTADDKCVVENAEQALAYAGRKSERPSWGTDESGVYCAFRLLDGYLHETAREMGCDDAAHRAFQLSAYGED